jgi:hypothetical protein
MCGSDTCAPARYQGTLDLPACCASTGGCGLDLRPLGAFRSVPTTCTARRAAGAPSDTCDSIVGGAGSLYQGCCTPSHVCGILVKLGSDLDLGCQPADDFVDDAGAAASCGLDAATD